MYKFKIVLILVSMWVRDNPDLTCLVVAKEDEYWEVQCLIRLDRFWEGKCGLTERGYRGITVCTYIHWRHGQQRQSMEPVSVNCHCHSVILFAANTKCGYQYPCTPSLRPERIKGMFNLSYCKHSASWMPRSCRRKLKGPRKPQPNQP